MKIVNPILEVKGGGGWGGGGGVHVAQLSKVLYLKKIVFIQHF